MSWPSTSLYYNTDVYEVGIVQHQKLTPASTVLCISRERDITGKEGWYIVWLLTCMRGWTLWEWHSSGGNIQDRKEQETQWEWCSIHCRRKRACRWVLPRNNYRNLFVTLYYLWIIFHHNYFLLFTFIIMIIFDIFLILFSFFFFQNQPFILSCFT